MNGQHWTDYTEAELAQLRAGRHVHASRPAHAKPRPHVPDVTAEARRFLAGLRHPVAAGGVDDGPAYPPEWLPEIKATMTPAEYMEQLPPPSRNGTAPAATPDSDAYPVEWLQGFGGLGSGALGGEGFLTDGREGS